MEVSYRIRLLGTVQVEKNGAPLRNFESRKALALLVYLGLVTKAGPIGEGEGTDVMVEFVGLESGELSELEPGDLSDLVPDVVGTDEVVTTDVEAELAAVSPAIAVGNASGQSELGLSGSGGGQGGGDGDGSGLGLAGGGGGSDGRRLCPDRVRPGRAQRRRHRASAAGTPERGAHRAHRSPRERSGGEESLACRPRAALTRT